MNEVSPEKQKRKEKTIHVSFKLLFCFLFLPFSFFLLFHGRLLSIPFPSSVSPRIPRFCIRLILLSTFPIRFVHRSSLLPSRLIHFYSYTFSSSHSSSLHLPFFLPRFLRLFFISLHPPFFLAPVPRLFIFLVYFPSLLPHSRSNSLHLSSCFIIFLIYLSTFRFPSYSFLFPAVLHLTSLKRCHLYSSFSPPPPPNKRFFTLLLFLSFFFLSFLLPPVPFLLITLFLVSSSSPVPLLFTLSFFFVSVFLHLASFFPSFLNSPLSFLQSLHLFVSTLHFVPPPRNMNAGVLVFSVVVL